MPLPTVSVILAAFTVGSSAPQQAVADNQTPVFNAPVASGSWFRVRNHKGSIEVRETSGRNVVVYATRRSEYGYGDPKYDVLRDGSNVTLCVIWPDTDRCDAGGYSYHSRERYDRETGKVDIVVELPRGVKIVAATGNGRVDVKNAGAEVDASSGNGEVSVLGAGGRVSISSGNGELRVEGAHGDVDASTGNGDISVSTSEGPVSASSGNGHIEVDMATLKSAGDMEFTTGNGSIDVKFPSNLSAIVEANGNAKDVETDFPMQMDAGWNTRHIQAKIGNGGRRIRFSTGNGRIRIRRAD
jgi:hypothetical protein